MQSAVLVGRVVRLSLCLSVCPSDRLSVWPGSRDPYKIWHSLKHIAKRSKATDLKFGIHVHVDNFSKRKTKNREKGCGLCHI